MRTKNGRTAVVVAPVVALAALVVGFATGSGALLAVGFLALTVMFLVAGVVMVAGLVRAARS